MCCKTNLIKFSLINNINTFYSPITTTYLYPILKLLNYKLLFGVILFLKIKLHL